MEQWWFHQGNASCHNSMLVTKWMANRGMKKIQHSANSPDLVLCCFSLFPHMKDSLKGAKLHSTQELNKTLEKSKKGY